jgi:hypothetical protein
MFVTIAATGCPYLLAASALPTRPLKRVLIAELRVLMAPPASAARQKLGLLQQQFPSATDDGLR